MAKVVRKFPYFWTTSLKQNLHANLIYFLSKFQNLHHFISYDKKFLGFQRLPGHCFQQPRIFLLILPWECFHRCWNFSKCQISPTGWLARKTERGASYRVAVAAHILTRHFRQPCCTISLHNTTHTDTDSDNLEAALLYNGFVGPSIHCVLICSHCIVNHLCP